MGDVRTCASCGAEIPADAPGGACPRCALAAALPGSSADPTPDEVAAKLPAFEILGVLGRGGMGVVFKARQKALDRVVALKVLPPATAKSPGFSERFVREARAMARLQHPNIVAVHEFGETDGLCWLVLEFVDGLNVREAMRAGRIGPAQALTIVPQICDALQYAHDRGVVHRDIKPENVMIDRDGRVRIADFGLAKLADREAGDPSLTGASQVMGTLHYMAPEQWERPKDVDHRCDIYSLGVVFYEMLTGELPVGKFEPPSKKAAIDVRVDEVVMRSLERNREQRWQRADEVKTKVTAISSSAAPSPSPAPAAPPSAPAPAAGAAPAPGVLAAADDGQPAKRISSLVVAAPFVAGFLLLVMALSMNDPGRIAPGYWWATVGCFALGALLGVAQYERKNQTSPAAQPARDSVMTPAPAAEPRPWLSPVMTGVAASAIIVLLACMAWGINVGGRAGGDAVGSLAIVLGLALGVLLLVRRHGVSQAAAAGHGPPGPAVLVGVASGAAFVLGLFCLVHATFLTKRFTDAPIPDEPAPPPPRRTARKPADDRAPWEFDVEVPKDCTTAPSDRTRKEIWERWHLAQALEGGASDDRAEPLYARDDWLRIVSIPRSDRATRAKEGALGLPMVDRAAIGAPLSKFSIASVRFGGLAGISFESAYVIATAGDRTLRFTMTYSPGLTEPNVYTWRFTAAPVEIE